MIDGDFANLLARVVFGIALGRLGGDSCSALFPSLILSFEIAFEFLLSVFCPAPGVRSTGLYEYFV